LTRGIISKTRRARLIDFGFRFRIIVGPNVTTMMGLESKIWNDITVFCTLDSPLGKIVSLAKSTPLPCTQDVKKTA
jgi:hypothetical protein